MVLVAGLLGVLYYLTFSGDSGAVNYSVKNKEAVTLILALKVQGRMKRCRI